MLITDKKELKKYYSCHRVWQGIPGIEHTKGGRTFVCAYSGGTDEYHGNYAFLLKSDNDEQFSEPIAVSYCGKSARCFDPCLWIDPLSRLWFIWNVMPGDKVFASICENPDADELIWGEEFYIGSGIMMNKPIVLSSGEWLFPISIWDYDISREMRGNSFDTSVTSGPYVYKTSDNGKTFIRLGCPKNRDRSFDEHMVLEQKNNILTMLIRAAHGINISYSYDRGKSWSVSAVSNIKGPDSRFHIKRLRSGRVLLINHYNFTGRNNLTALLSEDDGKTFPYSLLLDERDWVSYPDATEDENGVIRIVYDRERGSYKAFLEEAQNDAREILIAKITEEDIINGKLVNPNSKLKIVASKLEKLAKEDSNPYDKPIEDDVFADILINTHIPENIINAVYGKYPLNCINVRNLDAKKLDKLIDEFVRSDYKDRSTLISIIKLIRNVPKAKSADNPLVEQTQNYIKEHLNENLTTSSIADAMNVSVNYLCHIFKNQTGTTVINYRNELRMTSAKLLLINSELSISEISEQTGFESTSYFSEIFTAFEKISPSNYRKIHKY